MTDLDNLRAELDEFAQPEKKGGRSPCEERNIAGFEDIQRFVEEHGHAPQHGEDHDIFERIYAVRLDRLRALEECRALLAKLDHQGLLSGAAIRSTVSAEQLGDEELLSELKGITGAPDITELKHVRPRAEIRAAEEIANREKCNDFDRFQPLFKQAESDLKAGIRKSRPFGKDASVAESNFFILGGQLVYVAEMGDMFRTPNGEPDARLRVIYSNGTESNLLLRSLQRALYKDEAGRRLTDRQPTDTDAGPLFSGVMGEGDVGSGTIYVLRSLSNHPYVAEHRELIHKIGVTGGKIETRIANAERDATYLLAKVEVVATYKLVGINRVKLENLLHRIFTPAQIDTLIQDRFGHTVRPREWFLVPLTVIEEAIQRIRDGTITNVIYDPKTASLVKV